MQQPKKSKCLSIRKKFANEVDVASLMILHIISIYLYSLQKKRAAFGFYSMKTVFFKAVGFFLKKGIIKFNKFVWGL